jgi:hypothetical protein
MRWRRRRHRRARLARKKLRDVQRGITFVLTMMDGVAAFLRDFAVSLERWMRGFVEACRLAGEAMAEADRLYREGVHG